MRHERERGDVRGLALALAVAIGCVGAVFDAWASWAATPSTAPELPFSASDVETSIEEALAWYQKVRIAMRSINDTSGVLFAREDEQAVVRVLGRAFDTALALAAL